MKILIMLLVILLVSSVIMGTLTVLGAPGWAVVAAGTLTGMAIGSMEVWQP